MRNFRAEMFNRRASNPKSRPDQVFASLGLRPGQCVVDVGAGGGYFSLRFAGAVGDGGRVYAVDMNRGFLEFIECSARERGLVNVEVVPVSGGRLVLPGGEVDLVFMRNVYHHLPDRVDYFRDLGCLLGPGGRVAVIDYVRGGFLSFRGIFRHYTPRETIVEELGEAGFVLREEFGFLPDQSFMIFSLKKNW